MGGFNFRQVLLWLGIGLLILAGFMIFVISGSHKSPSILSGGNSMGVKSNGSPAPVPSPVAPGTPITPPAPPTPPATTTPPQATVGPQAIGPAAQVDPPADPVDPPVPLPVPPAAAPGQVTWQMADERRFSGRQAWEKYHPYYVIDANPIGQNTAEKVLHWRWYEDEEPTEYHPDDELMLNSSRVIDRSIRLAKQTPHTVRWEVTFHGGTGVGLVEDGAVIGDRAGEDDFPIAAGDIHTLVLERTGAQLSLQVDGGAIKKIPLPADDRTPLRITAQVIRVLLRTTKLSFGNGEQLAPALEPKIVTHPLRWVKVLDEDFAKPESANLLVVSPETGRLQWSKEDGAMQFGPVAREDKPDHAYVLLHRSLPGDLRVSFRARSQMADQPAFFGLLLNLKGTLKKEDAYFVEWNYWQVQIKKRNVRQAGGGVKFDHDKTNAWSHFRVEKVGAKITLYTDSKEVLTWTDPHPYRDRDHDLFTFYTWMVPMEIDDLVIERNALDPVKPREDDPAVAAHYLNGQRPDSAAPVVNEDEF